MTNATATEVLLADSTASPAPARVSRKARAWWALFAAVALVLVLVTVFSDHHNGSADFDPDSPTPGGSHALAALLAQRGVTVKRVATVEDAVSAANGRPVTVVLPVAELVVDPEQLRFLRPGRIVAFAPGDAILNVIAPGVQRAGTSRGQVADPGCALPAATAAGRALMGGDTYDVSGTAVTCYAVGGRPSLVTLGGGPDVVVAGSSDVLRNSSLADEGNAALALNLLSGHDTVFWVLPHPGEIPPAAGQSSDPADYFPHRLVAALWTIGLAVFLLALAFGRRLGRVVIEPLPVVVRAAEAAEGKARLYRAARARERAGGWLRDSALHELRTRLGLAADAPPPVVADAVAARSGRPREDVTTTLYGNPPTTDRDLVALADSLDRLTAEVRRQ